MCKTNYLIKSLLFITFVSIFVGCSRTTLINVPLYEIPTDWQNDSIKTSTIFNYSKYLAGKKIFLDPGHGGEDRKNKNAKGDVIEADVNLRVALSLRLFFEKAGARVLMSREKDTTVQLVDRSELANQSGADLFISIHHNAPGKTEDVSTDYTSVYYHAKDVNYEYEPCNQDMARYVARDLSYVMRNSTGLGSFDGSYSDYNIYPGEGFSVLRKTIIPAILVENAFHTSRWEELRLNNEEFNQIQAWGIFRGIAKYLRAGIPRIELIADSIKILNKSLHVVYALRDSSGVDPRSIRFFCNKEEMNFSYDKKNNYVSAQIDSVNEGNYDFRLIAANKNGNHALPFRKCILIDSINRITIGD